MQGILISLATAVTLAIVGAFAAPLVVDWNAWRGSFEREIGRTLGVPVVIRGAIEAEILPAPRVTLNDVTLGDVVSTGGTVRQFKAELSLGALMRGQVEATGVTLVGPRLRLVLDSNGHVALPAGTGAPSEIGIARLDVRDGSLDLLDRASDHTFTLTDLDLSGEARSLTGPFKLDGEVEAAGARFGVRSSLGKLDEAGSGKLRLVLDGRTRPYALDLDGAFSTAGGTPGFDGRASLTRNGKGSLQSWQLSGHLKASPAQMLADRLELALGGAATPAQLSGAARLTLGRSLGLDVVLNARSLDLDALGASGEAGSSASPAIRPAATLGQALWALAELPTPDIASRIGMSAEQLVLGGTVVRDVRLDVSGGPEGWRVDTAEAQLPGKAQMKIDGAPKDGGFAGTLAFSAEDPAAFLRWAAPEAAREAAEVIAGPARIDSQLAVAPGRISLDGLNAAFGESRLRGSIAAALPDNGGPKLDMKLDMEGFDLDPIVAGLQRAAAAVGGGADARLVLDGRRLVVAGQPLGSIALTASATGGSWRVKRVVMNDLGGIRLEGAGWMENFSTTPRGEFNLAMNGPKADGLVPVARLVAGEETATVLSRLVPVAAPVNLTTSVVWREAGGRSITCDGTLGEMSGTVAFSRSAADVPLAVNLSAQTKDAARVLGALGIGGLNPRLGPAQGELSLTPLTQGQGQVRARLALDGLTLSGEGPVRLVNGMITPQLAMRADGADLGRLLPEVAAGAGNGAVPTALGFTLTREANLWRLGDIKGSLGGAPMDGRLELEPGAVPRLAGQLKFDTLSVPAIIGLFGARAPAAERGAGPPWSTGAFQPNTVSGIALGLDLSADRLALLGPYTLTDGRLRVSSDGVDLDLRDISGGFGGGRAGAQIQVRRHNDLVEAEGRLNLAQVELPALASAGGAPQPPAGRVSLALDLGGSGRSLAQLVASLTGQGTLSVANLDVRAADPGALDAVLAEAARLPAPPDERRTALLFDEALGRGPLRLAGAESTLGVVNGVARLSPARTTAGPARVALSGSLDLSRLAMEASIEFEGTSQAGASPSGTLLWRGPVTAPDRRVSSPGLTSVIAMRAIERETRRLEEQRGLAPAPATPASAPPAPNLSPARSPALAAPVAAPAAPAAAPSRSPPPVAAPVAAPAPPASDATPPATTPRAAQPPAAAPAQSVRRTPGTIERQDLPPPLPAPALAPAIAPGAAPAFTPSSASTGPASPPPPHRTAPATASTSPGPEPARPALTPEPSVPARTTRTPPAAQTRPPAPSRAVERPPVLRPPLPTEPTLPPTRGFGDLPRPPGLVGE